MYQVPPRLMRYLTLMTRFLTNIHSGLQENCCSHRNMRLDMEGVRWTSRSSPGALTLLDLLSAIVHLPVSSVCYWRMLLASLLCILIAMTSFCRFQITKFSWFIRRCLCLVPQSIWSISCHFLPTFPNLCFIWDEGFARLSVGQKVLWSDKFGHAKRLLHFINLKNC